MVLVGKMVQDTSEELKVVLKSLPGITLFLALEGRDSQEQNQCFQQRGMGLREPRIEKIEMCGAVNSESRTSSGRETIRQ